MNLLREINLGLLNRTELDDIFFKNHKLCYGIHDDYGIESFHVCDDWDSPKGLVNLTSRIQSLKLRSRYNTHRNSDYYVCFLRTDFFNEINRKLENYNYIEGANILLKNYIKIDI